MYSVSVLQYKLISPALGPLVIKYFTHIYVISHKIHCHYFCFK